MKCKKTLAAVGVALMLATGLSAAQASSDSAVSATEHLKEDGTIRAFKAQVPIGSRNPGMTLPQTHGSRVDQDGHRGVGLAKRVMGKTFNSTEVDEATGEIIVHVNVTPNETIKDLVGQAMGATKWRLVQDPFSRSDVENESWQLASSQKKINGRTVISAGPNADSSAIQVILEGSRHEARELHAAGKFAKYPVEITYNAAPLASSRASDPAAPHWGGADMSTPGEPGYSIHCTTGFGIGYMSGSTLVTEHLTADHCGPTGSQWGTGNHSSHPILGTMQNTSAVGTDSKRMTGAQWGPVVYGGDPLSNTGIGIKGAVTPILNDMYCYSGSQSGIVCGNKVGSMNQTVCYGVSGPCYRNQVYTDQVDNIPASGQGDSGGPVLANRNGSAYAAGVISGMWNYSDQCTGYGERLCSVHNILAPIEGFFQDNPSYGILTY